MRDKEGSEERGGGGREGEGGLERRLSTNSQWTSQNKGRMGAKLPSTQQGSIFLSFSLALPPPPMCADYLTPAINHRLPVNKDQHQISAKLGYSDLFFFVNKQKKRQIFSFNYLIFLSCEN